MCAYISLRLIRDVASRAASRRSLPRSVTAIRIVVSPILLMALGAAVFAQTPSDPGARPSAPPSITSRVDKLFEAWDKPDSPGCALGVVKDGRLIYEHGYGMADLEHNVPITPKTAFDIASISKQFTGLAILLLAREGKVTLDDDVRKYIPEVPDYGARITLRHLLYHTSGLRNLFLMGQLRGHRWGDLETNFDTLAAVTRQKELNFRPGDQHSYTNTGYFLLGEVVKRVTGTSLREFIRQSIFKPLGMNDTQLHDDVSLIVKNRAWGYGGDNGTWVNNITRDENVGPSNVYTTIEDMARWDQNFYAATVGGESVIAQMLTPGTLNDGRQITYGGGSYAAGLRLGDYKGLKLVWHAGSSSSRSEYLRFPDQHFSVFCLCNTGAIDPSELARKVADIYLADMLKPEPVSSPPSPEEQARGAAEAAAFIKEHTISVSEDKLAGLAGLYVNPDNGNTRRLLMKGGKLMLERRPGLENELVPTGENRFQMSGIPIKLEVSFKETWPGLPVMLISTGPGTPLALVYIGSAPASAAPMTDYAGAFHSEEADATVRVVVMSNRLVLRTRDSENPQPPRTDFTARGFYPLEPIAGDAFKNEWIGVLRFTRDSKSHVNGFVVSNFAGGVRHLEFHKAP